MNALSLESPRQWSKCGNQDYIKWFRKTGHRCSHIEYIRSGVKLVRSNRYYNGGYGLSLVICKQGIGSHCCKVRHVYLVPYCKVPIGDTYPGQTIEKSIGNDCEELYANEYSWYMAEVESSYSNQFNVEYIYIWTEGIKTI